METDRPGDDGRKTPPRGPFGWMIDGLNAVGSLVIAAVMALMCADVLMRNIANQPIDGVAEMVAASIVIIVFLQLPSTVRQSCCGNRSISSAGSNGGGTAMIPVSARTMVTGC